MSEPSREVQIRSRGRRTEIIVDGIDLADSVSGLQLNMSPNEIPHLVLDVLRPHAEFDGMARVSVVGDELDPGPAADQFLAAIDAEELEKSALRREDLDPGPQGLTRAMLAQLREWARGES